MEIELTQAIAEHGLEKLEPLLKMIAIEPVATANDNNMQDNGDEVQLEQDEVDGLLIESATTDDVFPDVDHIDGFAIEANI